MFFSNLLFDLDDTLYPPNSGLWQAIRDRMSQYMWEVVGLPVDQVPELRRVYFEEYGTTLRGLQIHYHVNADEYLAYVHDLPLRNYIAPVPGLRDLLLSLPQQRWVFTNSDMNHATRVLEVLELSDCFKGIIDIRSVDFACKPEKIAYQKAMLLVGEENPFQCVFFDDSPRNLAPARQLGFFTVLVGSNQPDPSSFRSINNLLELQSAVPELWDEDPQ
jgi:putative hydrolase of the HAD superfamily